MCFLSLRNFRWDVSEIWLKSALLNHNIADILRGKKDKTEEAA